MKKPQSLPSPVSAPVVIAEVAPEVEAPVAEAPVAPVAPVEAVTDPVEQLRLLVAQRESEVGAAAAAMASGFNAEKLVALNTANAALGVAQQALASRIAERDAAEFIPNLVAFLGGAAVNVPHSVWGQVVRFEVTFTSGQTPSVRRIAQPTVAPSGTYSPSRPVTRNRTASGVRDPRLPGQGSWFASQRIVIRISDDSEQVSAWQIGGIPMMFGSISSACTKLLGVSTNGYAYTNLGSTEDVWSDASPRKGWSRGEIPANLCPAKF